MEIVPKLRARPATPPGARAKGPATDSTARHGAAQDSLLQVLVHFLGSLLRAPLPQAFKAKASAPVWPLRAPSCSLRLRRGSFSHFPMRELPSSWVPGERRPWKRKQLFFPPSLGSSLSSLLSPNGPWCCLFPCIPKWPWHDLVVSAN